ncbi:MAG TPA: DEAD/DEAH box helicase [Firmicutes bacterium]|nr:DEAD/DEAH box helicase [Bacillota bacterium]HHY98578.1 DEAD/DEAH box helicase [Bacillota bacterium]
MIEASEIYQYKGIILDRFQREAIDSILKGRSVLVSAPTGAGKTLIADFLIDEVLARMGKAIYTAPIKALSNQKYKDFKAVHGAENVGIVTGDVVINDTAPILVMTTEILRNILHTDINRLEGVSHVVFDEIHYLGDKERGSVWEEAIIFLPGTIKILGLSATIPNARELADWMSEARGEKVDVVWHLERPVPLVHSLFEKNLGPCTLHDVVKYYNKQRRKAMHRGLRRFGGNRRRSNQDFDLGSDDPFRDCDYDDDHGADGHDIFPATTHIDLIDYLNPDFLPCLYFLFSRQQCEVRAAELARHHSFLSGPEIEEVGRFFDERIEGFSVSDLPTTQALRRVLTRGIGFHHAGLLPVLKGIVEDLFAQRKIYVLYCTETFALGVNLPVKTVCFDSPEKFDGIGYRPMTHQEYFQMAGRAGRRGIDSQGYVFTLVDLNFFRKEQYPIYEEKRVEDLESQFKLSYNTCLNLITKYDENEIRVLLDKSFAAYQRRRKITNIAEEIERLKEKRDDLASELGLDENRRLPRSDARRLRRLNNRIDFLSRELAGSYSAAFLMDEFERKVQVLRYLDYIVGGGIASIRSKRHRKGEPASPELTLKGLMASRINVQELLVTELLWGGFFHRLDEDQINALAVAIDYEPRRESFGIKRAPFDMDAIQDIVNRIRRTEMEILGHSTVIFDPSLSTLAYLWSKGIEFIDLMAVAKAGPIPSALASRLEKSLNLNRNSLRRVYINDMSAEGDIVLALRRAIDLLRQVKLACPEDEELIQKINRCMDKMDRDVVRVDL